MKCPKCSADNADTNLFCLQCGSRLTGETSDQTVSSQPTSDPIRSVIVRRFEALKNKDATVLTVLMDEQYSKFDDWPPYQRQERTQALENEFSAFEVLSSYTYELRDFKANALGDSAFASFVINYKATMRNQEFDITSRVTTVLTKRDSMWKIVHEHLSRFPSDNQPVRQQFGRRRFPF